jgi:hypothetical protein
VRRVHRALQAWVKRERRLKALGNRMLDRSETDETKPAVIVPREAMLR